VTSPAVTVTVTKIATSLSMVWTAPTKSADTVVKGDDATFYGDLIETYTGIGISGKTIWLCYTDPAGVEHLDVASDITDAAGHYSIVYTLPTTTGTYTFWTRFKGDETYEASNSPERTVIIEARTPVLTFDITPTTVMPGETLTWSGEMYDPKVTTYKIAGKTIYLQISEDGVTFTDTADTAVTGTDGTYSGTTTAPTPGTYYYRAMFPGGSPSPSHQPSPSRVVRVEVGGLQRGRMRGRAPVRRHSFRYDFSY